MILYPNILTFITTYRCVSKCRDCCFGCAPTRTQALSIESMHKYIEQAKELPSIKTIVFTGGECFLLGRQLDELIKKANRNGYITRVITNGYWATSYDAANKRLDSLMNAGLNEINLLTTGL